ncbi:MAG TPA: flagellar hook-length control protein FliK [Clostridiales bacterium]|nr:flagellar hook-length control protein FliK [Clostridiales bacterium]
MVLVTMDGFIQPQKSVLSLKQTQNEGKDFLSVFNQSLSKSNDSSNDVQTTPSETKQKQLENLSDMRTQNKNKTKHFDVAQKLPKSELSAEDSDEAQQDFLAQFEALLALLETFNFDIQEPIMAEESILTSTEGVNFFLSDEQISALNAFLNQFLDQYQAELSEEQFLKISDFLQFLSTKPDMESCCSQAQKLLEALNMLPGSENSDAQKDLVQLNLVLSDTDKAADKYEILQPEENIRKPADNAQAFSETDQNLSTVQKNRTESKEMIFKPVEHADMELADMEKQQDELEGNVLLKEATQGNIHTESAHSNPFKDIFVLENKSIASTKPDIYHILNQVMEQAQIFLKEKGAEMHLQLQPDHLGKLVMKIAVEKGSVIANIVVENQAVKEVLESNLILLKNALNEKGFGIQGFHVSVGQDSSTDKYPNPMKSRKKNIGQSLSMLQNSEQKISEMIASPISLYATQIDYLG